jgi:hypothetical protein
MGKMARKASDVESRTPVPGGGTALSFVMSALFILELLPFPLSCCKPAPQFKLAAKDRNAEINK